MSSSAFESISYITVIPNDSSSSTVTKSLIFSIAISSLTSIFFVSSSSEDTSSVHPASRREATRRSAKVFFMLLTKTRRLINISLGKTATEKDQIDQLGGYRRLMKANSVEEEPEHLAKLVEEAEALGIDPWPEKKPPRPWAKFALASFMIVMMLSWVSRWMYRFVEV